MLRSLENLQTGLAFTYALKRTQDVNKISDLESLYRFYAKYNEDHQQQSKFQERPQTLN